MNKKEENLVGKRITLYLDGGWEVSGLVHSFSEKKIILEQDVSDELFLVFRDKVSCLKIAANTKSARDRVPEPEPERPLYSRSSSEFPMNRMNYDDSAMSIPRGLLHDLPDEYDEDFSISFSGTDTEEKDKIFNKIDFKVDDDSRKKD